MLFENWVNENIKNFSEESYNLMYESILCYRIRAYRASFLFSYLGFLKYLKTYLNISKKPASFTEERWENIIKEIKKEDKWEERINKELMNSTSPIFNISDNIRNQLQFFRDRRNDCAHAKNNIIDHNHVEVLWNFLISNISKINIEGAKQNLIIKFVEQFDNSKNSKFEKYDHLINEIDKTVEISEYNSFINELYSSLNEKYLTDEYFFEISSKIYTYYKSNHELALSLNNFLKNENIDLYFLNYFPECFNFLNYNKKEIRTIWTTKVYVSSLKYLRHTILNCVLQNCNFTDLELEEFTKLYIENFDQRGFNNLTKNINFRNNIANQYFSKEIYETYFENKKMKNANYEIINKKADLISLFLEKIELKDEYLLTLSETYKSFNPSFLTQAIKEFLNNNSDLKEKFSNKCSELKIDNISFLYLS